MSLRFKYRFWIETGDGAYLLGEGGFRLLKEIEKTQSLSSAAENLGMSYSYAWKKIKKMEEAAEDPLVESSRGGKEKGKTCLTEYGRTLLSLYNEMETKIKDLKMEGEVLTMDDVLDKLEATIRREEEHENHRLIEFSINEIYYSRITMRIYEDKIVLETPVLYIENPNASKELFDKHKGNFEEIKEEKEYKYAKTLSRDTHQLRGYIKKIVRKSCIVGLNYELRYYHKYNSDDAVDLLEKYDYPIEFD
jgi:molybdate transport system regulatory protein